MNIELTEHQKKAVKELKNGSILCGDVGSGKSIVSLYYYVYCICGGYSNESKSLLKNPVDLYIITTAKKRDTLEWGAECSNFGIKKGKNDLFNFTVDSWNNVQKYIDVVDSFFIFDEQRVIGSGSWSASFIKISKKNRWILLSATPGDCWSDYISVFIANGFYKNKSEFEWEHCIFARFSKYPKIERYIGLDKLEKNKKKITVYLKCDKKSVRKIHDMYVNYDLEKFNLVYKDRWDVYNNKPIKECGKWVYLMRKVVNSDESRIQIVLSIIKNKNKVIIFYNFDYELEILRKNLESNSITYSEWNGKKHEEIPNGDQWAYVVQYSSASEGWNCITTDTVIFYSQNYSYRIMEQSMGRIDRMNTPYKELHYYNILSRSLIDGMIRRCLNKKKKFNEKKFFGDVSF